HGSPICYGLPVCLPPCTDLTRLLRPSGTFTSGLQTGRSPFPLPDMTTTATGLLCWRDFHPLERQLASLHQHSLPSGRYALLGPDLYEAPLVQNLFLPNPKTFF